MLKAIIKRIPLQELLPDQPRSVGLTTFKLCIPRTRQMSIIWSPVASDFMYEDSIEIRLWRILRDA